MQPAACGMFLVHRPIVLWLQYWLFDFDIPAIAKALMALVLTVFLSRGATEALRKIPREGSGRPATMTDPVDHPATIGFDFPR